MWGSKTKQSKAIKKWHYKAMLVDPRKVEISIIWAEMPETNESQETLENMASNPKTIESTVIAEASTQGAEEGLKAVDPNFEIAEDFFDATESDPKIEESNTVEKQDFDEAEDDLENIETILEPLESNMSNEQETACFSGIGKEPINTIAVAEQTSEILRSETAETLSTNDGVETLETLDPILQNADWDRDKVQVNFETVSDLETIEQNPESVAPACSIAPNAIAETLKEEESVEMNAPDAYEPADGACELVATERESLNIRFLRVLEKTRSKWYNDKQLAKIVKKMEKGKNLKRKEFDRVYMHIRTYCGYN